MGGSAKPGGSSLWFSLGDLLVFRQGPNKCRFFSWIGLCVCCTLVANTKGPKGSMVWCFCIVSGLLQGESQVFQVVF